MMITRDTLSSLDERFFLTNNSFNEYVLHINSCNLNFFSLFVLTVTHTYIDIYYVYIILMKYICVIFICVCVCAKLSSVICQKLFVNITLMAAKSTVLYISPKL